MRKMLTSLVCLMCAVCFSVPVMSTLGARSVDYAESSVIPYDAVVEYIEGDEGAYIDTGHTIGNMFWWAATVQITEVSYSYKMILGARQASGNKDYEYGFYLNMFLGRYGAVGGSNQVYVAYQKTDYIDIDVTSDREVYLNGNLQGTMAYREPSLHNLYIFAMNQNGTPMSFGRCVRIYSLRIGDDSDEFDFIPVRIGEEGFLYDRCRGRLFGNVGTGAFIIGPDVEP